VKLARLAYHELARRIPDYVLVGIPGTTSFSGFVQKLGWINPFHFKYLFIPRAVFQVVRRLRRSRGLEFVVVSAADASFRRYFEHREPDGDVIAPLLSAEFLQWRVLDNQSHAYTLVTVHEKGEMIGFVVYRPVDRGRVFIEMIDFRSPHYWKGPHLTATLWFLFENSRARSLYTWEPTQDRLAVAYKKAGLLWNPLGKGAFSYATPFIVRSAQMSFRGLDLRRRAT
jgi:hypothetical protein